MTTPLRQPTTTEAFTEDTIRETDGMTWFHVFSTETHPGTKADTFSEGWGAARFSPISQADGTPVHTYYVTSSFECAVMESVLHDVPLHPAGTFEVDRLRHFHLAQLNLPYDLNYVSFHSPYLPKLSISRTALIDSSSKNYPTTRNWAQAAFLQRPAAQAIGYGSRRHDAARCLMLFGQRLPSPRMKVLDCASLASGALREATVDLMRRLDIHLI
jgi:hypothetical protein